MVCHWCLERLIKVGSVALQILRSDLLMAQGKKQADIQTLRPFCFHSLFTVTSTLCLQFSVGEDLTLPTPNSNMQNP